jgi:hypothetical protein
MIASQQIVVHKKMNMPPHGSGLVTDTSINDRMILFEFEQSLANRRRRHDQLRPATARRS